MECRRNVWFVYIDAELPVRNNRLLALIRYNVIFVRTLICPHENAFLGMPPDDTTLTDDYVAKLLAKDAKESTIKYSSLGLQAFLPKRYETCS